MPTPVLILLCVILPALWGWLTEALLRRIWCRRDSSASQNPDDREPAVDFQI